MGKRRYRALDVKDVDWAKLGQRVRGRDVVLGGDMAKEVHYGALLDAEKTVVLIWKWDQLSESEELVRQLGKLPVSSLAVAIEPSGTYGDPFRHLAQSQGIAVHRVSPKRCHDYSEVYDGVPSQHDAKCAVLLGRLHLEGYSEPWTIARSSQRALNAAVGMMDVFQGQHQRHLGQLEAQLARYWPESTRLLGLDSATLLEVLIAYGDPAEVARQSQTSAALMRRVGRLKAEKVEALISSARTTIGLPMEALERELLRTIAREARRSQKLLKDAKDRVQEIGSSHPVIQALSPWLGSATAAVLLVAIGDPRDFANAASYRKAYGLNLKIRSSGKHKGQLRITKRGSGLARQWLFLAVLRMLKTNRIAHAWYERKVARDGGVKMKAVTAVMRKVSTAVWHVAQGAPFDSRKLFDTRRLKAAS